MRCPKLIALILLSFIVTNCSKGSTSSNEPDGEVMPEEPVQEVYFTFNVDGSIQDENHDNWLILHDNKGVLLDYRSFEKGEQLIFEKRNDSIPDNFSVTLLRVKFPTLDPCVGDAEHVLETFPEIEKGSIWSFPNNGISDNDLPEKLGKFKLIVADIPGTDATRLFKSSWVSTPRYDFLTGGIIASNNTNTALRLEFSETDLFENTKYLVSIMDEGLNLNYKFFESPMLDEVVNFNFGEFQQYDSYAYLPSFPPNLFNVFRLEGQTIGENRSNDRGYLIQEIINTNIQDSLPMGFLDEFDYYKTNFQITFENFSYGYIRFGPKPQIDIPNEPVLSISKAQITNFEISTDLDYIRKSNNWGNSDAETCSYTSWTAHSNKNNYPKNLIVPLSITDQYGSMQIDDLKLLYSVFWLQSDSYDNFIFNKFKFPTPPNDIKEYTEEFISFSH